MTRISFLHGVPHRLKAAADWLTRASGEGRSVVVFAPDPAVADWLDRQLWVQPATGFVPHCRAGSPLAAETLVVIADRLPAATDAALLNLDSEIPAGFEGCREVIEIVSTDDADRLPARERYRRYREQGHELSNLSMGTLP